MISFGVNLLSPPVEALIQEEESCLLLEEESTSDDELRAAMKRERQRGSEQLRNEVYLMQAKGYELSEIAEKISSISKEWRAARIRFCADWQASQKTRAEEKAKRESFKARIQEQPLSLLPIKLPSGDSSEESCFQEWVNGKLAHQIGHNAGKKQGYAYEFLSHVTTAPISKNSKNPWRDRTISTLTHIGIAETLGLCLPHGLTAYTVTLAAHGMGHLGHHAEKSIRQVATNEEIAENWNRQWVLSGQEGPNFNSAIAWGSALSTTVQVPKQLLDAIHHEIAHLMERCADKIGLTDEAVERTVKRTLELMAERHPKLLQEIIWEESNY